ISHLGTFKAVFQYFLNWHFVQRNKDSIKNNNLRIYSVPANFAGFFSVPNNLEEMSDLFYMGNLQNS
ncbi:MAG: hypothetical protein ACK559_13460, partial [bacterium]